MSEETTVQIIAVVVSSFSLLGAVFMIGLFLGFPQLRSFPFKYVFWLSISDMISSIGFLLVTDALHKGTSSSLTCIVQGFLINFGQLASIAWTAAIAWTLYYSTVKVIPDLQIKTQRNITILAFLIPFAMSTMPLFLDMYGQTGGWCWIKSSQDDSERVFELILAGIQFYIPLWTAFVFNGITIYRVIKYVRSITQDKKQRKLVKRLILYPLILLICWTAGTVHRLFDFFGLDSQILAYLHIFFGGLQGFFNAIVYGLNSNVRKIIQQNLCTKLPCFKVVFQQYEEHKNLNEIEENREKKISSVSSGEAAVEMESLNR